MPGTDRNHGFTLVEVLVALAIVSIGMLAVFKVIADTAHNVAYLRDRSFAAWIADNRITEIRLSGEMPSVDETRGELEFAGRRWHWVQKVSNTAVDDLRRIDVSVRRDGDSADASLISLAGFIGATAAATPPSPTPWPAHPSDQGGDGGDGGDPDDAT
jgi:general secretion pathway protein I